MNFYGFCRIVVLEIQKEAGLVYHLFMPTEPTDNDPKIEADSPTIPPESNVDGEDQTIAPMQAKSSTGENLSLHLPGYEIQQELGRGGMGVVYKARDVKLGRIVALKMVIGGKFATEEELQRFRLEGAAAAKLDHSGIVPIYEIGESGGNHFFSMKFIDGKSLAECADDFRGDEKAIVELMAKIAGAVQHAHERGVLHRDLKPANILLDSENDPAITDFGLAKQMGTDRDLTKTGIVMGTPGFMAPEQAAGKKDITTSADVFSLGAIMYWLITRQAPFIGETPFQTVMNTIEGETPSVRLAVPSASADLDLICKKAMHKDPGERYSSSAALAADLKAWLGGEMLSVRAPTAVSLATIWIRKNMRMILGACLTGLVCGLLVGGLAIMRLIKAAAIREHQFLEMGGSNATWVSNFIGLRHMSDAWSTAQFLIVPIVAICGFCCVLLVSPQ